MIQNTFVQFFFIGCAVRQRNVRAHMPQKKKIKKKLTTAGCLRPTSQPLVLEVSDKCLAHYVMYICFAANLLNVHPTLALQCP